MRLIIRDTAKDASSYIAEYIIRRIREYNPTPENKFVLGLPTGSSPETIYKVLVREYKAGNISFKNVITFNMDEYVGIPRDHPESYHSFMYHHFFSHVDVDPSNIHILNGNAPDLKAECDEYERKIKAAGGIELFLGGIGPDGHIAFNEPGSSLSSRTRVKTLAEDTIRANARFFDNDKSKVPRMALTVGIQTVLDAREVVIIITGAHKSLALQRCIEGGVNHMWTLSALQLHPCTMIAVDEDATLELQVKTVKYFKSIEHVQLDNVSHESNAIVASTASAPVVAVAPVDEQTETEAKASELRKDLKIDTEPKTVGEDDDGLTPDSMSPRIHDSGIAMDTPVKKDEAIFEGMGSRVEVVEA